MSAATLTHQDHEDEAAYDLVPDGLDPVPTRPRLLLVGTALAGAGIAVFFAALLGMYLAARHAVITGPQVGDVAPIWFADSSPIPLTPANLALATMLLSCVTMAWAVHAVAHNDRAWAYFALAMTLLFGGAVINATVFIYKAIELPVAGGSTAVAPLFYTLTGAHLALIACAMVFVTVMTLRTLGGEYAGRDREGIVAASLIWYLTTALLVVIWYAVYVTK